MWPPAQQWGGCLGLCSAGRAESKWERAGGRGGESRREVRKRREGSGDTGPPPASSFSSTSSSSSDAQSKPRTRVNTALRSDEASGVDE
eukprot:2160822-Pyramimonas_sp.AAC.1